MSAENAILAAIFGPLAGALAIALAGRVSANLRESVTLVTAAGLIGVVWSLLPQVYAGGRPAVGLAELVPGIEIAFRVEPLGMLFAALASGLWIINSLYSIGYMRGNKERNQTRFYTCFAIALGATMGIAFAANLVTLFVFYEILTLSTYPLVAHKGDEKTVRSARVYLGVLLTTSIGLLLPAIIWTYVAAGTGDFTPGGILAGKLDGPMVGLLLGLFVFGIGKVIVYVFGVDFLFSVPSSSWLLYAAAFTVIAASLVALRQSNLKRLLAYSTVAQLSYVVMAAAILKPLAEIGAAVHMVAHAFGKITLFFAAGAIYVASKKTEVFQLRGIGRRMPWTMTAFTIGALSMIGVPPTGGFVSKWFILAGAFQDDNYVAIATIIASTALNAAYFLPIVYLAWFTKEKEPPAIDHGEAPRPAVIALTITAALTILFFFFNETVLELERQVVAGMTP